jgi:AraC-like DNA-binding protein/quercetin dioxygenase-like cupin family protein
MVDIHSRDGGVGKVSDSRQGKLTVWDHQESKTEFVRDPELAHIEARFSCYRQHVFRKHTHNTYSIGLVTQGMTDFYRKERTITVGPRDIALINPGEVHACNPTNGSVLTYYMFYVGTDLIRETASALSGECGSLPRFSHAVIQDRVLAKALTNVYALMLSSRDRLEKETCLYETMSRLVLKYTAQQVSSTTPDGSFERMQTARKYLMDHISDNVSVRDLSALVGLSPYHFLRSFRSVYGIPPHGYRLQQRIDIAKQMLANGASIASTAADTGFADQSHLTRVFKSIVGATPRQYQSVGQ